MFHMDLGLGRVESALRCLELDSAAPASIQVLGTNGKGSTSTFLAQALTCSGLRAGLYTSPHFVSPRERILVDGLPLPDKAWLDAAEAVLRVSHDQGEALRLTYFELLTVMAAWLFREAGCDACVFEAGLGGAHDATTALPRHLTVFTPIGMDHAAILGPTVKDIARDKAGAMLRGVPSLTVRQDAEVESVLIEQALRNNTPLYTVPRDPGRLGLEALLAPEGHAPAKPLAAWEGLGLPTPAMPGPHQRTNFQLAACALGLLSLTRDTLFPAGTGRDKTAPPPMPDAGVLERTAREAFIPGRFQVIAARTGAPAFILDGAHNLPGLECLRDALDDLGLHPSAMVFSCLADKDLDAMIPLARALTDGPVYVPPVDAPGRAMDPAALAALLGGDALPTPGVDQALREAARHGGLVLICGSLYLLGEVFALRPGWLARG